MIKDLVMSSCRRIGVNARDMYAVWCGKVLDSDKYLSAYPIVRDSTVEIRSRLRAGQPLTFDQKFANKTANDLFINVVLPPSLINSLNSVTSVNFFSDFSKFNIKKVLMSVTRMHRVGRSYNGAFNSTDILFHHGAVRISSVIRWVPFNERTCARDYLKLYQIFKNKFSPFQYPLYFNHLLEYLQQCPDKGMSRTEAIIAFVTNHPCLEAYVDRMKQLMVLDNMLFRHPAHLQYNIASMGSFAGWSSVITDVPEMFAVYVYHARIIGGQQFVNPLYTDNSRGCLHYANNYMKHASNQIYAYEMEAAFSLQFEDFLPEILINLARIVPNRPYVVDLLVNRQADTDTGN